MGSSNRGTQIVTSIIFLANEAVLFYDVKCMSVTNYFY